MQTDLFEALVAARRRPDDPGVINALAAAFSGVLATLSAGTLDPDDIRQQALIRATSRWTTCTADSARGVRAWLRTILRRVARECDQRTLRMHGGGSGEPIDPGPAPDAAADDHALAEALDLSVASAKTLDPTKLPARWRAAARRCRIGRDMATVARNVEVAVAVRLDGVPTSAVAAQHGWSEDQVRQTVVRGAAAIGIAAGLGAERARSPVLRGALLELADRGGVHKSGSPGPARVGMSENVAPKPCDRHVRGVGRPRSVREPVCVGDFAHRRARNATAPANPPSVARGTPPRRANSPPRATKPDPRRRFRLPRRTEARRAADFALLTVRNPTAPPMARSRRVRKVARRIERRRVRSPAVDRPTGWDASTSTRRSAVARELIPAQMVTEVVYCRACSRSSTGPIGDRFDGEVGLPRRRDNDG